MAKRATSFDLTLPPRPAHVPAYRWLYDALRQHILEGRLPPGTRLPGTRDIARQYGLSRGTIVTAFEQLREEGYLQGSVGSGTFVSIVLPAEPTAARARSRASAAPAHPRRRLSAYAARTRPFHTPDPQPPRSFRAHLPALDLFPLTLWSRIAARRIRGLSTAQMIGCEPMGYLPLRAAIATYLRSARGVHCDAAQVLITSGTQETLDLVTRLFVAPGARVALENPGYTGAARAFESIGARIATLAVDDEGLQLRPAALRDARLIYCTPAHQFPTGVAMSLQRRLDLLEWARGSGGLVFEDDYDSEYRYSGRPLPALQGLDRHGVVLFAGSFSKLLFPSLRLAYLVVPPDLVDAVAAAKGVVSRHAPLLEQVVLGEFIEAGHFARHLRRMREVYATRLAALLAQGRARWRGLLELSPIDAGLQTAAWLAPGLLDTAVVAAAAQRGVEVTPLSRYTRGPVLRQGLMLGFASVDLPEIRRGVRELGIALEQLAG